MKLRPDDERYEDWAATFQTVQADLVNEILKENGVEDAGLRKRICGSIVFRLGDFLDQCWFKHDGTKVYPVLCYSDASPQDEEERGVERTLFPPTEDFDYHEYAWGTVGSYFDDLKERSDVETGSFEVDDEDSAGEDE